MSAFSLHTATISQVRDALDSLTAVLKKGENAPNAASLPASYIHQDMRPLTFQVHNATNTAQKLLARLTGTEAKELENNLKSFDDMYARLAETREMLTKVDQDLINNKVSQTVPMGLGPGKNIDMPAPVYALSYIMPTVFFHVVTAYNILRKEGVPLGKMDYLNPYLGRHITEQ